MAIEYTWSVPQTDYTIDPTTGNIDKITVIHWRCNATEGEATATSYGMVSVPEDDAFADPAQATDEAAAIAAAQRLVGQAEVEAGLADKLDVQAAPTSGSGRIWDIPVGTPVWRAGVTYAVNDVALYEGVPYTCLQGHNSQRGWFPPNVPALWSIQNQGGGGGPVEWVAGEAVGVGDQRTYQGVTYEVIQAHTTQADWTPPAAPTLWAVV